MFKPRQGLAIAIIVLSGACATAPVERTPDRLPLPDPVGIPTTPAGAPAIIGYAPGAHSWVVEQAGVVRQIEPAPSPDMPQADSVYNSATIDLEFERSDTDGLTLEGMVSRMNTLLLRGADSTEISLQRPVHFSGSFTTFRRNLALDFPEGEPLCDESGDAALALARSVLIPIPRDLAAGRRWTDEASWTGCRGGVPVTTTSSTTYEAHEQRGERGVLRIERQSTFTISGGGTQGVQEVSVRGEGSSAGSFIFDAFTGRVRSGSSQTSLQLLFETVQQTFRLAQESRMTLTTAAPRQ